jgi:NitT/TauT family transport system substrate-binding protein
MTADRVTDKPGKQRPVEQGSEQMSGLVRLGGALAVTVLLAFPTQAQSLKPWRQAMILPKADAGFFLMAAKRGFAEREGLKVEVLEVKDDPIGMKALLSGEVDSYDGVYGAIAAFARGADVKLLGCNWHAAPYVMLARPGVERIEDLRGKSVAASSPGTPPDMVARAALVQAKVPPAEVKIAAVGGDRDRFTALIGGVVDAAVVSNEYLPLPSVKSLRVLVEARQVLPQFLRFCTLVTGKTLNDRREDLVRFMTAQIKAVRYAVTHRDETIALTREAIGAKPDDPRPAFVYEEGLKPGVVDADFSIPLESLVWSQDQMIALGQLARGGDINKLIYPDIRKEALARIGH